MKMSFPMKLLKNHDESDETRSEYYDHKAIRFRGQKNQEKTYKKEKKGITCVFTLHQLFYSRS